jgi:hypothetical protein
MKLAIIGSRNFSDYESLKTVIQGIESLNKIDLIISGGAKGADTLAERYAKENSIPIQIFYPEWDKYGKPAGVIRNTRIVNESDMILAIWDGKSIGTKDTIIKARKQGKPVQLYYF